MTDPIASMRKFSAYESFTYFTAFPSSGELFSKLNSNKASGERISFYFVPRNFF